MYEQFFKIYSKVVQELKLNPGEHPPWQRFEVSLLQISDDDLLKNANLMTGVSFKHITAYTMNPVDILLTKYHRGLPKDLKDIQAYLSKYGLSRSMLQERYFKILRQQKQPDVRTQFGRRYEQFIKDFAQYIK